MYQQQAAGAHGGKEKGRLGWGAVAELQDAQLQLELALQELQLDNGSCVSRQPVILQRQFESAAQGGEGARQPLLQCSLCKCGRSQGQHAYRFASLLLRPLDIQLDEDLVARPAPSRTLSRPALC